MSLLDISMDKLRAVEWGKTWLWDVQFPTDPPPAPFDKFLPVISLEENNYTATSEEFPIYNTTVKIPKGTTLFDIKMTFVDDSKGTMRNYFNKWVNEINLAGDTGLNSGKMLPTSGTRSLYQCARKIDIFKYDIDRKTLVEDNHYMVFPEAALYFTGNSESAIPQYEVQLIIAGTI